MNPLSLIYKSEAENTLESEHISQILKELNAGDIDYYYREIPIFYQTSSYSDSTVSILKSTDVNAMSNRFGHLPITLKEGEALFLPPSASTYNQLNSRIVNTLLIESDVTVEIAGAYPHQLFPAHSIGTNAIVLNEVDFKKVSQSIAMSGLEPTAYYAFDIPEWQKTKDIGLEISDDVTESFMLGTTSLLPYSFDNPGMNYSVIRTTFSLLLLIGLLLAAVFFLAAGSFIYFRLYTTLDRDRKQFDVLSRMGLTEREFKKIVNRQLFPQFFFPWGVAFLHSVFSFLFLQVVWDALVEISIVKELVFVLLGFTVMQISYFYLIRWRYLAHIKAPG